MTEYTTRPDGRLGYRILDPLPTREELEAFYRETYYRLIDEGRRAADIGRSRRGGPDADDQGRWLAETVHRDIADTITAHTRGRRVIEVGCGLGDLMVSLRDGGFDPVGVDLAQSAVETVRAKGMTVRQGAFTDLVNAGDLLPDSVDAVLFANVLEQTFDPVANLEAARRILVPGGVAVVRSGNDFNPLQEAAVAGLDMTRWWVSGPEHINYLSFDAVEAMMGDVGLEPVDRQADFPMELFLLLGFPYIGDSDLGAECHRRRVMLERILPTEVRRRLYRALAQAGMGRCLLVTGRKPPVSLA